MKHDIYRKMDGNVRHYIKQNKSVSERQVIMFCIVLSHMWNSCVCVFARTHVCAHGHADCKRGKGTARGEKDILMVEEGELGTSVKHK